MFFKQISTLLLAAFTVISCDVVPKEAVELSNTVGRDLEEVHRAHRDLVNLHYSEQERRVNTFIDDVYRPAFISKFAEEFDLANRVTVIVDKDASKLLPVMVRFVETSVNRIEAKRTQLLEPILAEKVSVLDEVDAAHRQIQSAHSVITGHLASVLKVREVQTELLAKANLGDLREKISSKAADLSGKVAELVAKGEDVAERVDNASDKIEQIDKTIDAWKSKFN